MKIIGDTRELVRVETGLHSFDRAFTNALGDIGFPIGTGIEIYGPTNCGKSTITFGLAGILATAIDSNIVLADFEGFDPIMMGTILTATKFDNTLYYIQEKQDEIALDRLVEYMRKKDYHIGILDSVGAISPIGEEAGVLGNRNMGQRAFLMAQFSRKMLNIVRNNDKKTMFSINHAYPVIGGRGMTTPGGEVKNYLNSIRIQVKRKYLKGKYEEFPDGSYIIEGKVVKNRWGYKDRIFNLFVLGGIGIHLGLTAMYDGISMGLVGRKRIITIGEQSFGSIKAITEQARQGNNEFFDPFFEILRNHQASPEPEIESDGEEETSEDAEETDDGD